MDKGKEAMNTIYKETGCKGRTSIDVWPLDLANHKSVLSFGERVRSQLPRLDAFIANAAVELQRFEVAENLEMQLTVNVVSNFLSAIAVLPKLRQTSEEYGVQTTMTFCGSMYHIFGPDSEFDIPDDVDLFDALSRPESIDIKWRYALTKLMVHQCFHELVSQLSKSKNDYSGVVLNIVNPGWCGTDLSRNKVSNIGEKGCFALIGWTAEKGSRPYIHALAAGKESHGKYMSECQYKPESQYVQSQRGQAIQKKMWRDLFNRIERISPQLVLQIR